MQKKGGPEVKNVVHFVGIIYGRFIFLIHYQLLNFFFSQFNDQVEECVLAQLGNPDTWGYALRTKWSMRDVISLDALCA